MMNRQEFMERLENLLQNIPEQERIEAIQYYNDYFDDAGKENEQAVLEALGTPAQVAENIKRDLNQNRYAYGCEQEKVSSGKEVVKYQPKMEKTEQEAPRKAKLSPGWIVMIVVLCIFASPVLLGVLLGISGALLGILAAVGAVILGFGLSAIVLFAGSLILFVIGIVCLLSSPLAGLGVVGGSLVMTAVGLCCLMVAVLVGGIAVPAAVKGIRWIFRKLTGKNKAV